MVGHKVIDKVAEAVASMNVPEGYSAVIVDPEGNVFLVVPTVGDDEVVPDGMMVAGAIAAVYSDAIQRKRIVDAVFSEDEEDEDQFDLDLMPTDGRFH